MKEFKLNYKPVLSKGPLDKKAVWTVKPFISNPDGTETEYHPAQVWYGAYKQKRLIETLDRTPSYTPDTPSTWLPNTRECWNKAQFYYLEIDKKTMSYKPVKACMAALPATLLEFPYDEQFTIAEKHKYVADNWHTMAGKKSDAVFEKLKQRIQIYNDTVSERCRTNDAWVARADSTRDNIIKGIVTQYEKDIVELRKCCIAVGVELTDLDKALLPVGRDEDYRAQWLQAADMLEIQLPDVVVPTKELYTVNDLPGYAKYGRYPAEIKEEVVQAVEQEAIEEPEESEESEESTDSEESTEFEWAVFLDTDVTDNDTPPVEGQWEREQLDARCARICARPLYGYKYVGESEVTPPKYTDEDFKTARKKQAVVRWTQDVTEALTTLREDLLILSAMYYAKIDDSDLFLKKDVWGELVDVDTRPAPITDEEILEWKQLEALRSTKEKHINPAWVGK